MTHPFTTAIIFATTALSLYYLSAILFLRCGLQRVINDSPAPSSNNLSFSVLIAARNEENNIAACLNAVLHQTIPTCQYEIIIVNDRSTDSTQSIVQDFVEQYPHISLINLMEVPAAISPKKYAISCGYALSKNEIIAVTDADCIVPEHWLASISHYMAEGVGLVQGITTYSRPDGINDLLFGIQALDFVSHGVIAAAAMGAGLPINGNANNMAYRRRAFEDCNGYAGVRGVVSGDDDLLLQKIWHSKKWRVRFMAAATAAVVTAPCLSWQAVFEQRKRWASKTVHYTMKQRLFLSGIFLFYSGLICAIGAPVLNSTLWSVPILMLIIKLCGEAVLLVPGTNLFGTKPLRKYFIIASLVQLPLTLAAVIAGVFGKFNWKDQQFKRTTKGTHCNGFDDRNN